MNDERYERGLEMLQRISGAAGERVIERVNHIAPDLGRFIVEFPYGDIYTRPALDLRARQIATVAALTTLGNARPQLKFHIDGALNVGCSEEEIVETIMHVGIYAGFPAALNAMFVAREVFSQRDPAAGPPN